MKCAKNKKKLQNISQKCLFKRGLKIQFSERVIENHFYNTVVKFVKRKMKIYS